MKATTKLKVSACPTGKRGYRSRAKAMKVLLHTRMSESQARRIYRCSRCGFWHLTKQVRTMKRAK